MVTPNAVEEANFFSPDQNADEEGIYDRGTFSRDIFIDILIRSVQSLKKAEMFEAAAEVYKLLVPMFESTRDYNKLAEAHGDLKTIYSDIIKVKKKRWKKVWPEKKKKRLTLRNLVCSELIIVSLSLAASLVICMSKSLFIVKRDWQSSATSVIVS